MNGADSLTGALCVWVAELDAAVLEVLADRLAPVLQARRGSGQEPAESWLDTKAAAAYLCLTVTAIHKLTAARRIPFEQEGPGCKCWFRRTDLDEWRGRGSPSRHRR